MSSMSVIRASSSISTVFGSGLTSFASTSARSSAQPAGCSTSSAVCAGPPQPAISRAPIAALVRLTLLRRTRFRDRLDIPIALADLKEVKYMHLIVQDAHAADKVHRLHFARPDLRRSERP